MKKGIVLLLLVFGLCMTGCANEEDVSSLNEYDMVQLDEPCHKKLCYAICGSICSMSLAQ